MREELNAIGQAVGQLQGKVNEPTLDCQLLLPGLLARLQEITTPAQSEKD